MALPFEQRLLRVFCDFSAGWVERAPNGTAVWPDDHWAQLRWGAESGLQTDIAYSPPLRSRAQVFGELQRGGLTDFLWQRVDQSVLWESFYSSYAFVASPIGRGLDCYRTWEALAMGAIPIVQRVPGFAVFDGLPIVQVDDWSQVNLPNLVYWAKKLGPEAGSVATMEKLTARYWFAG